MRELLAAVKPVAAAPRRCSVDGRPPRRLERRAYNPTSHGVGMYYNWKIERVGAELLLDQIEEYRQGGWRIGSLSPADGEIQAAWDVLWVVDDDSNFLWGTTVEALGTLGKTVAELSAAGKRILHISPSVDVGDLDDAEFVVTWIADGKYAFDSGDDESPGGLDNPLWGVFVLNTQSGDSAFHSANQTRVSVSMDELVAAGFRPIWSSCVPPAVILVMVNDGFQVGWAFRLQAAVDEEYDPNDMLADPSVAGLVPHCIDCYAIPVLGPNAPSEFWWSMLFLEDPDLDPNLAPGSDWSLRFPQPALPVPAQQLNLIAGGRKILAFTTRRLKKPGASHFGFKNFEVAYIESSTYRPQFRTISVCEESGNLDPWIASPINSLAINLAVRFFMLVNNMTAAAIAIRLPTGWQVRRGYTLAPLCYPNTYPESQFRAASVSKVITATAMLRSLADAGYDSIDYGDVRLLGDILTDVKPSVGDTAYPKAVFDVTIQQIFTHTTPWSQKATLGGFNPGENAPTLCNAVAASETPLGYLDPSGRTTLPLTRDVYYFYMLNEVAFGQNSKWADIDLGDPTEVAQALGETVGWIGSVPNIAAQSNYSGWTVDFSALAIERLGNAEGLDGLVGLEYAGYLARVKKLVLDPLGMTSTAGGFTRRRSPNRYEVVFPGGGYLEQTVPDVIVTPFSKTNLFVPSDDGEPAYSGARPVDADATPTYVSGPYGGLRLESVVPAGGWVSTAVDLARLSGTLQLNNPVLPLTWVLNVARVELPNDTLTKGGWGQAPNNSGDTTYQFFGSLGYSGALTLFNASRGLHVAGVSAPAAGVDALVTLLDNALASFGVGG